MTDTEVVVRNYQKELVQSYVLLARVSLSFLYVRPEWNRGREKKQKVVETLVLENTNISHMCMNIWITIIFTSSTIHRPTNPTVIITTINITQQHKIEEREKMVNKPRNPQVRTVYETRKEKKRLGNKIPVIHKQRAEGITRDNSFCSKNLRKRKEITYTLIDNT